MEDKLLELCNLWKRANERRVATQNALKVAKQEDDLAKQELDEIANELLVEMMSQDVPSVNFEGLTFDSQGVSTKRIINTKLAMRMISVHCLQEAFMKVTLKGLEEHNLDKIEGIVSIEEHPVLRVKEADNA
jgi:hypothetical protein